jgi:phosphoribosylanthranilate isomerase
MNSMGLKTIVKINKVSNLADARYCAGMGVQMLGFCLDKHQTNFIEAKKAQEIASWVVGVKIVGEISSEIASDLSDYPLAMLEVDNPQLINDLAQSEQHQHAPLIYRIVIDNEETLAQLSETLGTYHTYVDYFLLESSLLKLNPRIIAILSNLCASFPILLGFGIDKLNVIAMLNQISPRGIAFDAGKATNAGMLDFEELIEILEALEAEEV